MLISVWDLCKPLYRVILGGVTVFALIAYWLTPAEMWLSKRQIQQIGDNQAFSKAHGLSPDTKEL